MGTELFRRPARLRGPVEPRGEIVLESPPELPETVSGGGAGQALTYLPMLAGAGATGLFVSGGGGSPLTYVASGMMGLSMVGMAAGGMGRGAGEKRRRLDGDRRDYQRYLQQVRQRVRNAAEAQRASRLWHHPDPDTLWCVAWAAGCGNGGPATRTSSSPASAAARSDWRCASSCPRPSRSRTSNRSRRRRCAASSAPTVRCRTCRPRCRCRRSAASPSPVRARRPAGWRARSSAS